MDNIKVSKEGYRSLERSLEDLNKKLIDVGKYKNKIAAENGDVWHDNNDFEQTEIMERSLMKEISDLKEKLRNAEIVTSDDVEGKVGFGSIVTVNIGSSDSPKEKETFLVSDSDEESEYYKISINSPIGKAIFNQEVGYVGNYDVNGKKWQVEILDIIKK